MGSLAVVRHPNDPTAVASAATLAATPVQSAIYDIRGYREVTIDIWYSANQASQRCFIAPVVSSAASLPASVDDDTWSLLADNDGSRSATNASAVATGADYTAAPAWSRATDRALEISLPAASANSDEVRISRTFNVSGRNWLHWIYGEEGGGTAGVLTLTMTRSV